MSRRDGPLALALCSLLLSAYLLTFSGVYHSSDEMSMLVATDSLARRGAWDTDLLRWQGEQQGSFGAGDHLYSRKGIGMTLVALPLYWLALQSAALGNVQAAMWVNGLLTALTGVLVYATLRRLRYGFGPSLGTALAYGLATMAWPYARFFFSETLAAAGLMLSMYALVSDRAHDLDPLPVDVGPPSSARPDGRPRSGRWHYPLLAGIGLALALLARLNNAIAVPFFGLWLLAGCYRRSGRRWPAWLGPLVAFGLPVLAALLLTGWYNGLRFGSPWITGYLPEERWSYSFFKGLYGLTFSPGKGLFWYNPILFAALIALPAFFRRHRIEAGVVCGVVLANVAFYAPWYLWWAGHAWGPRFLVAILPLAILPLAPAIAAAARSRALAVSLALLAALSVTVQALGVAVSFNLYLEDIFAELGLYHPATLFDPSYSPLVRQWGYLRPENLDLAWMQKAAVRGPVLGLGLALLAISLVALWRAWRGRWRAWAGVGLILLLALGSAGMLALLAPAGDAAAAGRLLEELERPGEIAVLADPHLTEELQNAYDGSLPLWGGSLQDLAKTTSAGAWIYGGRGAQPGPVRFQAGTVRLEAHLPPGHPFDPARLPLPADAEWARLGGLAQVAADVREHTLRPGDNLELIVVWRALGASATSYTLFVQAVDDQGGKAGQLDRLPCGGECLTPGWQPGDIVGERLLLPIRPDAQPGTYRLILGMYDLQTGQRLPVLDARGGAAGDSLSLGTLTIR